MGRTARFDQIYVANLDAQPVEEETLTGVTSILTREIEADEVIADRFSVSNTTPTKGFSLGTKLFMDKDDTIVFDLKERGRASRFFVDNQLSVGTTNPTKAFQVDSGGSNKVNIDLTGKDLMSVNGNLVSTNVIVTHNFTTQGANVVINGLKQNVIEVIGNVQSTNLIATSNLDVGSNISFSDAGANIAILTGNVTHLGDYYIEGNVSITGNIYVSDTTKYVSYAPAVTEQPVIFAGSGNDGSVEPGLMMAAGDIADSNVAFAFTDDSRFGDSTKELSIFRTSQYPSFATFTVDTTKTVNLHVYGDMYTSSNIGANNTFPTHDLCVGDKFRVDTTLPADSNVLEVDGFTYTKGLKIGSLGLQVGTAVTVNPLGVVDPSASVISISGNIQSKGIRTTGADGWLSGIANTNPKDTLDIGTPAQVTCNLYDGNTWYVYGNTYSSNLLVDYARITGDTRIGGPGNVNDDSEYSIKSTGQLLIHANDSSADNDTSNTLILKSGAVAANVSVIEVESASKSAPHQKIVFKTKNTERMRITADGKLGFNNTAPSDQVTIAAPVRINFANTLTLGNIFGSSTQTSMQMRVRPNQGDAYIEAHGAPYKGINFGVTSTGTMGTPKMTITDYGGVGIGVTDPHGRLNTSGATVYVNRQVTNNNNYDHTTTPLVVTNQNAISGVDDPQTVMILSRESTSGYGAKALFDLDRWNASGSRTRMDIKLAHDSYDDVDIMSIRSDGRVGIGTTDPTAPMQINSSGAGNPSNNGLVVYNPSASEGQDSIITIKAGTNKSDAFTSYTDDANQGWSVGMTDRTGDRDFRITNNVYAVSNVLHTALFIDGVSSNVGIGTDATYAKFTVDGDVRVGNELSFGGVTDDEGALRHHTFMLEQQYGNEGDATSELFVFKGNDGVSRGAGAGPDRIRHVAAEHLFQVYDGTAAVTQSDLNSIIGNEAVADLFNTTPVMAITGNERVLISTADDTAPTTGTKLYVNGNIEIPKEQSFTTGGMEIKSSEADTNNILNSISANRDFVFQVNDAERMRIRSWGSVGMGTDSPKSNLHVYSSRTANQEILKLESPAAASGTSKSTFVVHKGDGYGGYIHGYKNVADSTSGLIIGGEYNNTEIDSISIRNTGSHSNVGIGTTTPTEGFHIYDRIARVEHSTSNAIIEFKTTQGISNIYATDTGNVYIRPKNTHVFIDGNLDITGDINFSGEFELGNEVGINLGGSSPQTNLHVNGGVITNSDQVSSKRYSQTFEIAAGAAKDVQLIFGDGAFYAKVTAILRRTDDSTVSDLSTMILELQGGTGDESAPTLDVAIGTKNVFGGTNAYPWNPIVLTGTRGVSIKPFNIDNPRIYSYDIFVELVSACGGKLTKITRDIEDDDSKLDTTTGGVTDIVTFSY